MQTAQYTEVNVLPMLQINLSRSSITYDRRVLRTRSRALLVFVGCLLKQKRLQPDTPWIGIDVLRRHLPSVHGKQMQRFVDALEKIGFPIVYESKTRGRYRLEIAAARVTSDLDAAGLDAFIGTADENPVTRPRGATLAQAANSLDEQNASLLNAIARSSLADAQFQDGNLDNDNDHAYDIWRRLIETLEPESKATALLKFSRVCRRLHRYVEAQEALRRLLRMIRSGVVATGSLEYRAQLSLAVLRYEQGRVNEARAIVNKFGIEACADDSVRGKYYNLKGLLACHAMRAWHQAALDSDAPPSPHELVAMLESASTCYRRALEYTARANDYQALQHICFNFGNLYIRAHRFRSPALEPRQLVVCGIHWIAQSEFICNKFGVGMDSVWNRIILLKAALDAELDMNDVITLSGGLFRQHADLESLAQATLKETMRIGNRIECASTLEVLAELARRKCDEATTANLRKQAHDIYRKLNRADLIRRLKTEFPPVSAGAR